MLDLICDHFFLASMAVSVFFALKIFFSFFAVIWMGSEYLADFHHDFIRVARGSSLHAPREA